jgi:hypothetical protein
MFFGSVWFLELQTLWRLVTILFMINLIILDMFVNCSTGAEFRQLISSMPFPGCWLTLAELPLRANFAFIIMFWFLYFM